MLSRVFFRPRPLGISKTFAASTTAYPDFPGIWQVLAIGGGGGGSGSDTFYGRYGVAGYPGSIATGPVSFNSSRAVTVGIGGGGGIGDSAGGQPGGGGYPSSFWSVTAAGGPGGSGTGTTFTGARPSSWPDNSAVGMSGAGGGISGSVHGGNARAGAVKLTLKG